jgi:hypothetical protein
MFVRQGADGTPFILTNTGIGLRHPGRSEVAVDASTKTKGFTPTISMRPVR